MRLEGYESETLTVSSFSECVICGFRSSAARGAVAKTPFFLEHFLSGIDSGRDGLIKAQSGLRSVGNYPRSQRGLSHVLDVPVQILNQG